MESNKHSYLEKLIEWGDYTKDTLNSVSEPESEINKWKEQIENWQTEIKNLNRSSEITTEDVESLQEVGQRIVFDIKNKEKKKAQPNYIPYGKHELPPLPYQYDALEPYISEEIMRLHHNEHHQSYVDGLNKAEKELYTNDTDEIKHWLREQAFHGSGHNLHTIFWYNMTPDSSKKPSGKIRNRIEEDFGSWNKFKEKFSDVAASVEGVGWAVLLWNPRSGRLAVQSFEKHQSFQLADSIPLLVLDMWEHAYYLQYKTDKEEYIKNWWNVVNWDNVNDRYVEARKLEWPLF
ncbi:Fe-Mn family superoxide dismutase [Virgibacillus natechei]|uniref:superoxide dismutase n=1 Tax=Virgibacillus natechei TaxID=1216297 RepID=A0ABS4IGD8_9BACI|nr:superoxide dismutase [Virgibacillus natechei]MBP1969650.1 Fe-Mn family superoxide dismutase [Virgibacillus natechei]UZD11378.1 superoxide dismutase [Virgibacillus natechei]